jgi:hypothetical protein
MVAVWEHPARMANATPALKQVIERRKKEAIAKGNLEF